MKQRFALLVSATLLLTACANNNDRATEKDDADSVADSSQLTDRGAAISAGTTPPPISAFASAFAFIRQQDSSFDAAKFQPEGMVTDTTAALPLHEAAIEPFRSYLVYNSDRSMAIDPVSANFVVRKKEGRQQLVQGGPDTEVALIDFKQKTRKRILFLGTMGLLLEAQWQGPSTVLLLGAEEAGEKLVPLMWKYNLQEGQLQAYRYAGTVQAQLGDYAEDQLNGRLR